MQTEKMTKALVLAKTAEKLLDALGNRFPDQYEALRYEIENLERIILWVRSVNPSL